MPIPTYDKMMFPILKLANTGIINNQIAVQKMSEFFNLTAEERNQLLPSGVESIIKNRTGWAITYLAKAGLLIRPKRSHFTITERGKSVLNKNPESITLNMLDQFPEFVEFKHKKKDKNTIINENYDANSKETPEERIEVAIDEISSAVKSEILSRMLDTSPEFFERLIIKLLLAMGYGGTTEEAGLHLGKSGDGGLDGVIKEDKLGLDSIYIQAKRYAPDNVVGRPALNGFSGSLAGAKSLKGVFVTTSSFSKEAYDYVKNLPQQRIILIDGEKLTTLMLEHNVGIRVEQTIELKKVDDDFFYD